jgi:hypothetical protein
MGRVWRASCACLLRVSGVCLVRVGRVSGACLERVWRVAPARRACGTYMVRRERDLCASGTCLVSVLLVSGASLV